MRLVPVPQPSYVGRELVPQHRGLPGTSPSATLSHRCLAGLLRQGREHLARCALEEAPLEAEVLLMHLLGISRAYLYSHGEMPVAQEEAEAFQSLLERRARHEPLAYITGEKEFFGLGFYVDPRTLIPRPETETLVEESLRLLGQKGAHSPLLADVGTGCGAIAIALAYHLPEAKVYATDISLEALQVAALNRLRHGLNGPQKVARLSGDPTVGSAIKGSPGKWARFAWGHLEDRVLLLWGSLLEPLPEPVDVILANLPYVPTADLATLAPEVACHEPLAALDGGRDGLDLIRGLLEEAPRWLRPGGRVLLEVGANQAAAVAQAAARFIPGAHIKIVRDLAGLERVVVAELAA